MPGKRIRKPKNANASADAGAAAAPAPPERKLPQGALPLPPAVQQAMHPELAGQDSYLIPYSRIPSRLTRGQNQTTDMMVYTRVRPNPNFTIPPALLKSEKEALQFITAGCDPNLDLDGTPIIMLMVRKRFLTCVKVLLATGKISNKIKNKVLVTLPECILRDLFKDLGPTLTKEKMQALFHANDEIAKELFTSLLATDEKKEVGTTQQVVFRIKDALMRVKEENMQEEKEYHMMWVAKLHWTQTLEMMLQANPTMIELTIAACVCKPTAVLFENTTFGPTNVETIDAINSHVKAEFKAEYAATRQRLFQYIKDKLRNDPYHFEELNNALYATQSTNDEELFNHIIKCLPQKSAEQYLSDLCCKDSNSHWMKSVVEAGVDVNTPSLSEQKVTYKKEVIYIPSGCSPLIPVIVRSHTEMARLLINQFNIDLNRTFMWIIDPAQQPQLTTLLMLACMWLAPDIIKLMIDSKRVDLDAIDSQGATALHLSAGVGQDHIVKMLIEAGADVFIKTLDGKTARQLAIEGGHEKVAKRLHIAEIEAKVKHYSPQLKRANILNVALRLWSLKPEFTETEMVVQCPDKDAKDKFTEVRFPLDKLPALIKTLDDNKALNSPKQLADVILKYLENPLAELVEEFSKLDADRFLAEVKKQESVVTGLVDAIDTLSTEHTPSKWLAESACLQAPLVAERLNASKAEWDALTQRFKEEKIASNAAIHLHALKALCRQIESDYRLLDFYVHELKIAEEKVRTTKIEPSSTGAKSVMQTAQVLIALDSKWQAKELEKARGLARKEARARLKTDPQFIAERKQYVESRKAYALQRRQALKAKQANVKAIAAATLREETKEASPGTVQDQTVIAEELNLLDIIFSFPFNQSSPVELLLERNALLLCLGRIADKLGPKHLRHATFHHYELFPLPGRDLVADAALNNDIRDMIDQYLIGSRDAKLFKQVMRSVIPKPTQDVCFQQLNFGAFELDLYMSLANQAETTELMPPEILQAAMWFTKARLASNVAPLFTSGVAQQLKSFSGYSIMTKFMGLTSVDHLLQLIRSAKKVRKAGNAIRHGAPLNRSAAAVDAKDFSATLPTGQLSGLNPAAGAAAAANAAMLPSAVSLPGTTADGSAPVLSLSRLGGK